MATLHPTPVKSPQHSPTSPTPTPPVTSEDPTTSTTSPAPQTSPSTVHPQQSPDPIWPSPSATPPDPDPSSVPAAQPPDQHQVQVSYTPSDPPHPSTAFTSAHNPSTPYLPPTIEPATSTAPTPASAAGSKIFVGGLSWETDEDSLRHYFEQIGPVLDCVIMRDRHTGHPRGFGFVTFADDDAAGAAASRRHDLDGRQVEAKRAVPRNEGGSGAMGPMGAVFGPGPRGGLGSQGARFADPGAGHRPHHTTKCKVFVGGLPSSCGVDEFRAYFSRFGDVVDAQVMIDHNTGNSRGFGFVTFGSEATVNNVVGPGKSNTDHEIMGKCVEVKRAEPKGAPSDRRNNRDNYNAGGAGPSGPRGPSAGSNDPANANGAGTNAAAAAAAAYYSNYPASLAEQYGAYYNNPQWQQYYAAMGYNFNAYPQGYNPYQQYLQAYMNTANAAANGGSGGANPMPSAGSGDATTGAGAGGPGAGAGGSGPGGSGGYDNGPGGSGRYGGSGGDMGQGGPQNGHGGGGNGGGGPGSRRASRRDDRYHPYR